DRYCQSNDLLGQQVDLARLHNRLESGPAKLQVFRMRRQGSPDVRNTVNSLGGLNVLEDRSNLGMVGILVHQFYGAHANYPQMLESTDTKPRGGSPWASEWRLHKCPQRFLQVFRNLGMVLPHVVHLPAMVGLDVELPFPEWRMHVL